VLFLNLCTKYGEGEEGRRESFKLDTLSKTSDHPEEIATSYSASGFSNTVKLIVTRAHTYRRAFGQSDSLAAGHQQADQQLSHSALRGNNKHRQQSLPVRRAYTRSTITWHNHGLFHPGTTESDGDNEVDRLCTSTLLELIDSEESIATPGPPTTLRPINGVWDMSNVKSIVLPAGHGERQRSFWSPPRAILADTFYLAILFSWTRLCRKKNNEKP